MERWTPDRSTVQQANLSAAMAAVGIDDYEAFFRWSVEDRAGFWEMAIGRLGITFRRPPDTIADSLSDPEATIWLPGARLNIVESCFGGDLSSRAIVARRGNETIHLTRSELLHLVQQVAGGLQARGVGPGGRVAIVMPMSVEAVAAYLATIWLGAGVVSIADSFAPQEIATRLRIGDADIVVTQDVVRRSEKILPMYEKVVASGAARIVSVDTGAGVPLRPQDHSWHTLLKAPSCSEPVDCDAADPINVLFSSGTTGDPKAVPWTHTTPLKAAMDGHFHQDIHPSDVVAWPTNLGWMMGPWLIFASMVNGASMALYDDLPTSRGFAQFVADARVTVLGVVPSLVAAWRANGATEGLDWSAIRLFSSTGEASDPADMAWLMDVAGGKPVIEYCGGTEIGGGYITGTVLQDAVPGTFTTPSLGLDIRLLDETGRPAPVGEAFLVPPSIGLSDTLLNRDHHLVYYEGVPEADVPLRRHGDQMEVLERSRYRALGRVDDTMNLGGIKVSSAEIERAASTVSGISECAAIGADPPGGGPSRLVLYVVLSPGVSYPVDSLRATIQAAIRTELNPLFKVHDVMVVDHLPRTASAKVMRRSLRAAYGESR